jgi:hypothetical protein
LAWLLLRPLIVSVNVSINRVRSPIQLNPQLLLLWGFRWILGSLKGEYISGQGTLFWIYGFISGFSKSGVCGIKILQSKWIRGFSILERNNYYFSSILAFSVWLLPFGKMA